MGDIGRRWPCDRALPINEHGPGAREDDVVGMEIQVEQGIAGPEWTLQIRRCGDGVHGPMELGQRARMPWHAAWVSRDVVEHRWPVDLLEDDLASADLEDLGHGDTVGAGVSHHRGFESSDGFGGGVAVALDHSAAADVEDVGPAPTRHETPAVGDGAHSS